MPPSSSSSSSHIIYYYYYYYYHHYYHHSSPGDLRILHQELQISTWTRTHLYYITLGLVT